jgi:hypothetical protein
MEWNWLLWAALALVAVYVFRLVVPSAIRYWKLKRM